MGYLLFEGNDLQLKFIPSKDFKDKNFLITFSIFKPDRNNVFDKGFGEGVFCEENINELHVITNKNNWYQSLEMIDCINIIKRIINRSQIAYTYGASMGGFAAITFSYNLNIPVIAFSPQAGLANFPVSSIWMSKGGSKISFIFNNIVNKKCLNSEGICFYDSHIGIDRCHMSFIKHNTKIKTINIPFGTHSVSSFIQKNYGLKKLVLEIFNKKFNKIFFIKQLYSSFNIKKSPQYILCSIRKEYKKNKNKGINLAKEYILQFPNNYIFYAQTGLYLLWERNFFDSIVFLKKGIELFPQHIDMNLHYTTALQYNGNIYAAFNHITFFIENNSIEDTRIKNKFQELNNLIKGNTSNSL